MSSDGLAKTFGRLFETPGQLCYLCLVMPQMWVWVALRAIDQTPGASVGPFYLAAGASLLAYFLARRKKTLVETFPRGVSLGCAAVMAASPALLCYASPIGGYFSVLALVCAMGASLAWCYLEYFGAMARLDTRRALSYLFVSFALVPALRLPLDLMPAPLAVLFSTVLSAAFLAAVHVVRRLPTENGTPADVSMGGTYSVAASAAELAAYGLVLGLFRVSAGGIHDSITYVFVNFAAKTAFPAVLFLVAEALRHRIGVGLLYRAAFVFVAACILVAANLGVNSATAFVLFDYARYIMVILVFTVLTVAARRTTLKPCAFFGAAMGAYELALGVGAVATSSLGMGGMPPGMLALDVLCLFSIATVLVESVRDNSELVVFGNGTAATNQKVGLEQVEVRCKELAESRGLTKREAECMLLICRGRSKRYIAETLCLSENTVRGYAKTLYAKLDVHSREELLDLMDIEKDQNR